MNRVQKKCLFTSAVFHVGVGVCVLLGSAFVPPPPPPAPPVDLGTQITILSPETMIKAEESAPAPGPIAPPSAPAPTTPRLITPPPEKPEVRDPEPPVVKPPPKPVQPKVKPTESAPEKPAPKAKPEKPKSKPVVEEMDDFAPDPKSKPTFKSTKAKPPKTKIQPKQEEDSSEDSDVAEAPAPTTTKKATKKAVIEVDITNVKASPDAEARAKAKAEAAEAAKAERAAQWRAYQEQRASGFRQAFNTLNKGMSGGTTIDIPWADRAAFASYGQLVQGAYDKAWMTPNDLEDDRPSVLVEIVVGRDGRVVSRRILRKSGIASMDKSVQRAIDDVTKLPAFPEGASDAQRTFKINFKPKAKRTVG